MKNEKTEKPMTPLNRFFDKAFFVFYVVALIAAVCFSSFVWFQKTYFATYWVNGQSMWPTLNSETKTAQGIPFNESSKSMNGATGVDYIIGDGHSYILDKLQRFDIIVCKYNDSDSFDKIKRVIVLPGETFYIDSTSKYDEGNGVLHILNEETGFFDVVEQPIDQDILHSGDYKAEHANFNFNVPMTLKENEYFVMGDNRGHSSDSRQQDHPITRANIEAKAIALVGRCKTIIPAGETSLQPVEVNYMWPRFF